MNLIYQMVEKAHLSEQLLGFVRICAMTGFLAATALVVNLNNKAFNKVMGQNAKRYWWIFLVFAVIPLALFLFIFDLIFRRVLEIG